MPKKVTVSSDSTPDLILVSQNFTNGLYHGVLDREALVTAVMDHVMATCFLDQTTELETSEDNRYIGDFALYGIEVTTTPCIQFVKKDPVMYPSDLHNIVVKVRENVPEANLSRTSIKSLEAVCRGTVTSACENLRVAIGEYLDRVLV